MAKLNLVVKASVEKARGKIENFLSQYDGRHITINVKANVRSASTSIQNLQSSAEKLKKTLESIKVNVNGSGKGNNASGGKSAQKQLKDYNAAFKESEKMYNKLKAQKEKLDSLYRNGKNTGTLSPSELASITKRSKAIQKAIDAEYKAMERYSRNTGKLGKQATQNHLNLIADSQRVLNGSSLTQSKYEGKVVSTKDTDALFKSLNSLQTTLTSRDKKLKSFVSNNNDIVTGSFTKLKEEYAGYSKEYEQLSMQADKYKEKIQSGKINKTELDGAEDVANRMKELSSNMDNVQKRMEHYTDPFKRMDNETKAFDKIGNRLTDYYNKYGTQLEKNIGLYNKWLTLTQRANSGQFASIAEANREFAAFRTEARQAGVEIETFGTKLQKTFGTRMRSALAGYGVMAGEMAVRDILRNTIEVDTAMTELKKVTDETDKGYADFLNNAQERAQKLGATLTETVSATADFARLGYSVSEASNLADVAIMYSNIGDGIQDIDQASSSVISTMQGFGLQSENAIDIVDKFNEVGNRFATTSADVGEGMRRSSAAMAAAGNDIDQSIALFTAAQEVTQDADVVGTAMKTISMRLRSTKSDMESAGIETEGMSENISTLRDEVLALSGVDIQLSANEYKDTFTILQEMSKVWGNLSDMTRANKLIVPLHGDM